MHLKKIFTTILVKLIFKFNGVIAALGAILLASYGQLNAATIYFSDDFESGLGQWQPGSGGVIVQDGAHGGVLTFNRTFSGGDIFSVFVAPQGSYLSFDYKGVGGFIGNGPGDWLAGENWANLETTLADDNTWQHYSVFVRTGGPIMMEIFNQTLGDPFSAEFDNIVVADQPVASIPDGGVTGGLLMIGFVGLTALRRKLA